MPTMEADQTVEIEFEVFCGTCKAGLCGQSEVRASRGRGMPQVIVEVCENCLRELRDEKDDELEDLRNIIVDLENQLANCEQS